MYKIKTIITEKEILDFYFANQKKEKREEEKVTEGDKHVQHQSVGFFTRRHMDYLYKFRQIQRLQVALTTYRYLLEGQAT